MRQVRWSGYGAEDDTWELAANILDEQLIDAFHQARRHSILGRLLD